MLHFASWYHSRTDMGGVARTTLIFTTNFCNIDAPRTTLEAIVIVMQHTSPFSFFCSSFCCTRGKRVHGSESVERNSCSVMVPGLAVQRFRILVRILPEIIFRVFKEIIRHADDHLVQQNNELF